MTRYTIAIADDHPLVLQAVRAVLSESSHFDIVHLCSSGPELLVRLAEAPTDIVVTDFGMSRDDRSVDGLALLKRVARVVPKARIVVLTAQAHPGVLACALKQSAHAIISKEDSLDELVHACHHVCGASSKPYCSPTIQVLLAEADATHGMRAPALTPKELEVVRLTAAGHSLVDVASRLSRSVSTVSSQKHTAMKKLNLRSSAELVRYAYEIGLI